MANKTRTVSPSATMTTMFESLTNGFGWNFDGLAKANAEAGRAWMQSWQAIGRELADFYNARWASDVEAMNKLAACKDPAEAMRLQADVVQAAAKQYMDEAVKVAGMASDAGADCYKQVDANFRRAAADAGESAMSKPAA